MLAGQLGHGVGRDGGGQHALVLGQDGGFAIGRGGAGIDDAAHAGVFGGDQDVEGGVHAVAVGGDGVGHGAGNAGQSGLMEDDLDAIDGAGADSGVGQVALEELHGLKANEVRPFAGNETVNAADGFAALQQCRRNGAADEAGGPGNQVFCQFPALAFPDRRREAPPCAR